MGNFEKRLFFGDTLQSPDTGHPLFSVSFLHFRMCFWSVCLQSECIKSSVGGIFAKPICIYKTYSPDSAIDLLTNVKPCLVFHQGTCAVLLSGPYLLSQALWNTFSWRPHNLNFCQSLGGFALRHACLISGMNKAQRQVIFFWELSKALLNNQDNCLKWIMCL